MRLQEAFRKIVHAFAYLLDAQRDPIAVEGVHVLSFPYYLLLHYLMCAQELLDWRKKPHLSNPFPRKRFERLRCGAFALERCAKTRNDRD